MHTRNAYQEPGPPSLNLARARLEPPEDVDVAVVGCGLGGLMAAALLAKTGLRVACFDSHYTAGGCATQFSRGPSHARYHFDVGVHYVGECNVSGPIPTMLREAGCQVEFVPLDPDGFDELIFGDFRFRIPVGHERYRERLKATFPSERKGIDRYCDFLEQVDRISKRADATRGKFSMGLAVDVLLHARLLARFQTSTIREFLDTCTRDPLLRGVMLGQNGDYGLPPSEVSAVLHAGLANHYFHGAFYPKGGGQRLADELACSIERHGGTIHLRRGVESIEVEKGRAVGLVTEPRRGERHRVGARYVISGADLPRTLLHLVGPEHLAGDWQRRASQFRMGEALFIAFLGIEGDLSRFGMRNANYWSFESPDMDSLYAATRQPGAPVAQAAYITSATLKDPGNPHHAPEGVSNVEVMSLVNGSPERWGTSFEGAATWQYKRSEEYLAHKTRIEDTLIERLDRVFPGMASAVVFRESATPLTHTRFTRATGGTGYGLAATPAQFLVNRPGYRGPLQGLYLCGASTRAGHGVVGAMMSGRAAAHCLLRDARNG